jgi:nitrate reductase beta subunit
MDIIIHAVNITNNVDTSGILKKLSNLETKMATIQDVIDAATAQQNVIVAAVESINVMVTEVRQLLAQGDNAAADALLAEIAANSQKMVEATLVNTEVAHLVDAVNGDPVVDPAA